MGAKRDYQDEYWTEAVGAALSEVDKFNLFTAEEIDDIAGSMRVSAEMQGQAFGWDVASSNLHAAREREQDDIRKELRRERAKITCRDCKGTGSITTYGGTFQSTSRCWKCNGNGRHDP